LAVLCTLTGCGGGAGGGSVIVARDVTPDNVAKRAMELYDANSDAAIKAEELEKSPALTAALPRLDANKDGAVAADEIAARMTAYQSQSDLLPVSVRVERGRRPLNGAEVVFTQAPFYGENLAEFKGTTDENGNVTLAAEGVDLPGMPIGMYEVRVSGPVTQQLGCEIAEDSPSGSRIVLSL
jgi:hypothetical protein